MREPSIRQNVRKAPGRSGMVTANTASRDSPISARSDTKRSRSKFMLAPLATATSERSRQPSRLAHAFRPARASAPEGSRMARVSSKASLMAAQIWSLSTRMMSSTNSRQSAKVSSPTRLTAVPSANRPTSFSVTGAPSARDWRMASASVVSTPMTLMPGRTAFT